MMGKAALAAAGYLDKGEGDQTFYRAKVATAHFYADQMLPLAAAYGVTVQSGAASLAALTDDML
jgi:acyl-CoA dehydrogenase